MKLLHWRKIKERHQSCMCLPTFQAFCPLPLNWAVGMDTREMGGQLVSCQCHDILSDTIWKCHHCIGQYSSFCPKMYGQTIEFGVNAWWVIFRLHRKCCHCIGLNPKNKVPLLLAATQGLETLLGLEVCNSASDCTVSHRTPVSLVVWPLQSNGIRCCSV